MRPAAALALLALAGCGKADNAPGPGEVTVGEARALDEAAEMLEQRRPPVEVSASASASAGAGTSAAEP